MVVKTTRQDKSCSAAPTQVKGSSSEDEIDGNCHVFEYIEKRFP